MPTERQPTAARSLKARRDTKQQALQLAQADPTAPRHQELLDVVERWVVPGV